MIPVNFMRQQEICIVATGVTLNLFKKNCCLFKDQALRVV